MVKSLRMRLQVWHAVILLLVIVGFCTVFYLQLTRSLIGEIDADLLSNARVLEGVLRSAPTGPGGPPGPPGPPRFGPPPRRNPNERPEFVPDFPPQRPPAEGGVPWLRGLNLPASTSRGPRDAPVYFAVFTREGDVLRSQPENRDIPAVKAQRPLEYRQIGGHREVLLQGPRQTTILVGRDVRRSMDRLRGWLFQLIASGVIVFAIGLLGGAWLSGAAIRPIKTISHTAAHVTANSLEQRIDTRKMDRELMELGHVLNSMFERIEHSFKQQTQFTADASHELRTPLAVLLTHCELALKCDRDIEAYKNALSTCQRAGIRMQGLVEDLLILARVDADKLDLQFRSVDLFAVAADAIDLYQPLAASRDVELRLTGEPVTIDGDERRLAQVLANLINNAVQYNRPGGVVVVTIGKREQTATIGVRDTGCGISASDLPMIFDRFFRVDQARSRTTGGSGLGLSICRGIVEGHGGRIDVDSQVDHGTNFEIQFPLRHVDAESPDR